jgi:RHS repeat-associated protein
MRVNPFNVAVFSRHRVQQLSPWVFACLLASIPAHAWAEYYWYDADAPAPQIHYTSGTGACHGGAQRILSSYQAGTTVKHRIQAFSASDIDGTEYLCSVTIYKKQLSLWLPVIVGQPFSVFQAGTPCPVAGRGDANGYCGAKQPRNECNGSNPILGAFGAKYQYEQDLAAGQLVPITLGRHYNHLATEVNAMGAGWRHEYERKVVVDDVNLGSAQFDPTVLTLQRQDGIRYRFTANGTAWQADADVKFKVTRLTDVDIGTTGWRVYTPDGLIESYNGAGDLTGITMMSGAALTLGYDTSHRLKTLTDPFGKAYTLGWDASSRINKVTAPDSTAYDYGYDGQGNLASVTYPNGTANGDTRNYVYNEAVNTNNNAYPNFLTGIVEPGNKRFATFKYDGSKRAVLSTHAGGAQQTSFVYVSDTNVQITGPLGTASTYTYATLNGVRMISGRTQAAGAGCNASSSAVAFDANGNTSSQDDFNQHRSCYAFDLARNLPTTLVEGLANTATCSTVIAAGATLPANSRKTTTSWHPDWRVITKQAEPNKLTTWVYNGQPDPFNGNATASCASVTPSYGTRTTTTLPDGKPIAVLCKRVEQSTTDANGALGFAATVGTGVSANTTPTDRIWAYTYNQYGQVLTEDGPRTDVLDKTTYAYWTDTSFTGTGLDAVGHTLGDMKSITDAAGNITNYTQYDKAGRLRQMTDANGVTTTLAYSARGFLTSRSVSAVGAATRTTSYHYDPRGLLDAVDLPAGLVSTSAGAAGSAQGRHYTYSYDDAHRLIGITSNSGEAVTYTPDNAGNIKQEDWKNATGAVALSTRREFDALGRLWKVIRTINGADAVTEVGYDAQGNPTTRQSPQVAAYGESTPPKETRRYNALDQLTTVEDALNGAAKPTTFTPKANDDTQALSTPNGSGWTYQRDGFGQALQDSSDAGSSTQTFDAAGNLSTRLDARGVTMTASYDVLNRLTSVVYTKAGSSDTSQNLSYTWDANTAGAPLACSNGKGRLCQVVDALGSTYYAYDAFGNPVSDRITQGGLSAAATTVAQWGYDGEDRLSASVANNSKAVALSRDLEGRANTVLGLVNSTATTLVSSTSYQPGSGATDRTAMGNSKVFDRDFDMGGAGLVTGVQDVAAQPANEDGDTPLPAWALVALGAGLLGAMNKRRAKAGATLMSVGLLSCLLPGLFMLGMLAMAPAAQAADAYGYDARANVNSHTVDGQTSTYQYDKLDRIKAETGQITQSIGYDPNGNRSSDANGSYTLVPNSNRLATRNGQAVSYDAAGNILSETVRLNGSLVTRSFTYDLPGRVQTVSINGVLKATYLYDHKGQRRRKTLTSPPAGTPAVTLYQYNPNGQLFEEISGSGGNMGQTLATYVWKDDIPSAVIYGPNTPSNPSAQDKVVYLEADTLNTPRKATDQTGKVVWTWNSDAFGSTSPNEDPDGDGQKTTLNLRFPGQYFDAESGLYYNVNRYYDPAVGRYTQPDPIGLAGGANPYAYTAGNPLSLVDPTGLVPECKFVGVAWVCVTPPPVVDPCDPMESRARDRRRAGTISANIVEGVRRKSQQSPPPMNRCEKQEAEDNKTCASLTWVDGARRRCYGNAAKRLAACEAGMPVEPLTW